jgi:mannosyltransferase
VSTPSQALERTPAVDRRGRSRSTLRAAAVVGALAVAISALGSWIPSLWGDEGTSVVSAARPIGSLFTMLGHVDAVHGLSYLALHVWVDVFGSSPFSVRFPSAVGIGVCAAAVVWLCSRFGSTPFAVTAGMLAAILPRLTYAGEEARSYAWDAAIAAVLCAIVVEIMRRPSPSRRWWVAYGVVLCVGVYAFLYLGLMIVAIGLVVWWMPGMRSQRRAFVVASAAALAAASPLIAFALGERHQVAFLAHRDVVNPTAVLQQMWFGSLPVAVLAWTLIGVAALGFLVDRPWRDGATPRIEPLALAWLLVPMGLLIAVSPLVPGFTARYGTFSAPAAAVLMAVGLRRLGRLGARSSGPLAVGSPRLPAALARWAGMRWPAVLVSIALVAAVLPVWVSQRGPYAKNGSDWNEIAATISSRAMPGDGIVFDEQSHPSRRPRLAMNTDPAAFRAVADVTLETPAARTDTWFDTVYTVSEAAARGRFSGVERVWVVEYKRAGVVDTWGIEELTALGYHRVEAIGQHSSVISLYTR